MTTPMLVLVAIVLGQIQASGDAYVENHLRPDDELVAKGDIVYIQHEMRNISNQILSLPDLIWGFNYAVKIDEGSEQKLYSGINARVEWRWKSYLCDPDASRKSTFVIAPWSVLDWKSGIVVTSNSPINIESTIYHHLIGIDTLGKERELALSIGHSKASVGVKGSVTKQPIGNFYAKLRSPREPRFETEFPLGGTFARMAPVSFECFDLPLKAEYNEPAKVFELREAIDPQAKLYRALTLVMMGNQWVATDGEARLEKEKEMFEYAALGGPFEREFLKERLTALFATKQFERGGFWPSPRLTSTGKKSKSGFSYWYLLIPAALIAGVLVWRLDKIPYIPIAEASNDPDQSPANGKLENL